MSPQDINNPLSNKAKQSSRTAEIHTRVTQLWAQSQFRVLALRLWSFHFDDREATFGQNGVVLCLLIWCVQSRRLFFFFNLYLGFMSSHGGVKTKRRSQLVL